ncbi:nitrous oxide reductase accessory protein NosL [Rugamonas sp. CCM 8940]|uniref:nitrous oxide reductase accessory protein NosL n=1 Tax=Rugamonas sp. CCM 8940 TaxID=2765359 RepID=UPI001F2C48D7|nr:nitrous oxide reductase accessory protein NosL [Rugamonas sp. CCM 8940]
MIATPRAARAATPRQMWGGLLMLALLGACSHTAPSAVAQEPNADTACVLDGMLLQDFPGPKGQIVYAEGKPDFFCDLMELFTTLRTPEQKRAVAGAYVQDMGKTDWDHPKGNWIPAKTAFFVVGSKLHGSMGPTLGAFSSAEEANKFIQQQGGKQLRFEQVTPEMADLTGGVMHDSGMSH